MLLKYSKPKQEILLLLMALLAGAILPLAFAPYNIWFLGVLSPTIIAWLWYEASPMYAFRLGLCFGIGLFGVGASWVYVSIHYYGNTGKALAALLTALFVLILALYPALQGYLLKKFYRLPSRGIFFLLGFPSSWVLFEWLRGWLFSGFPWLYLGYTQLDTPLGNYAPLLGIYGVSWMVALSAGCLMLFQRSTLRSGWTQRSGSTQRSTPTLLLCLIWGGGYLLQIPSWTIPEGSMQTVSLIQGNVSPLDKFTQLNPIEATEALYGKLSETEWGTDIIVWPENAIPLPLPYSASYVEKLNTQAKKFNSTLITGIQQMHNTTEYYNSMIALGAGSGIYHKRHLVPFGEFLPFDAQLRGLIHFFDIPMSNFTEGPKEQDLLHSKRGELLAPLVCYEIAYPEIVRLAAIKANLMVNISEDGWFGSSWGPHQHLEIARMRAKETGRMILRATTSGISAIIDVKGKIIARSPQFQVFVLKGTVQGFIGETLWVKIGLWPILSILLGLFVWGSYLSNTQK